jgi:PHD finger protein 20
MSPSVPTPSTPKKSPRKSPRKDHLVEDGAMELINCVCGYTEEDGLIIQCDLCFCWQHGSCNLIDREEDVPDKFICHVCRSPSKERKSRKYSHDQDWLKKGTLPIK